MQITLQTVYVCVMIRHANLATRVDGLAMFEVNQLRQFHRAAKAVQRRMQRDNQNDLTGHALYYRFAADTRRQLNPVDTGNAVYPPLDKSGIHGVFYYPARCCNGNQAPDDAIRQARIAL